MREAGRSGHREVPRSEGGSNVLGLQGVAVAFGGQPLFGPLSFNLFRGEAAIVKGPSGSGKSTLLRVVAGLAPVVAGEVTLWGETEYRGSHRIGLTLDDPRLWPWMNEIETVRCIAGLNGVRLDRHGASALLSELNLYGARKTKAAELSQGMARRVQLAGALAVGRDLLLLDEPTASLDEDNAEIVWASLERRRRAGVPMVIATHDESWEEHFHAAIVVELKSK